MTRHHAIALLRQVAGAFHLHRWFLALIAIYVGASTLAMAWMGRFDQISLFLYGPLAPSLLQSMVATMAVVVAVRFGYLLCRHRPARPSRFAIEQLKGFATPDRFFLALPIFVALPMFMSAFTDMKAMIPIFNPYHWDRALTAWDRTLHGGVDAWRLLHPLLGHPPITAALSGAYQLWFLALFGSWLWQAFSKSDPRLRMQFFLCFLLLWSVIGTLGAILFSSGGPAFYGRLVGGPDPFAPLMDYLRMVDRFAPVWALSTQDMLWSAYEAKRTTIGSGISAMPSMHVATSLLFALLARRRSRILGRCAFGFLALILLGAVHLGWHYAADGYVSLAATLMLWRFAGWMTGRMPEFADAAPAPLTEPVPA